MTAVWPGTYGNPLNSTNRKESEDCLRKPDQVWREQIVVQNHLVRSATLAQQPAIAKIRNMKPGDLAPQCAGS